MMDSPFPSASSRHRILVADDDEINRDILAAILGDEYDVDTAENGQQAMDLLLSAGKDYSLVCTDILMPVMDGFAFLKKKTEIKVLRDLPVIVLTSEANLEVEALHLGAIDFIKKPFESPDIIHARVKRVIDLYDSVRTIRLTSVDAITGLYTKEYFDLYAGEKIRRGGDLCMVAIHLANFAISEELLGHDAIEASAAGVGRFLRSEQKRTGAIATRASKDVIYYFGPTEEDYSPLFDGVVAALSQAEHGSRLRVKLGVYPHVDPALSLNELFTRADVAYSAVIDDPVHDIQTWDEKLYETYVFNDELVQRFDTALAQGEFQVFFQPKYDVTGDQPILAGAEALVRWRHPERGMVSPGLFIPLFEKNGLIRRLDRFVYGEAVRVIARIRDELGVDLPISVNVSRVDIFDPELPQIFQRLVDQYRLNAKSLHLEITETAYAESTDGLIAIAKSLSQSGFEIEMDDFGSGYSSLNMLSDLPFDILKIDMGFVRNMHKSQKNELILKSIVDIAKYLNVRVVAEGVETKEQLDTLRRFGCDLIQGYYFSKPLPEEEFFQRVKGERAS